MTDSPWLSLLRRLTAAAPTWAVWKSPDSALVGEGDVDSTAAEPEWPTVVGEFEAWARWEGAGPVIRCTHFPGLLILVACVGERPMRLLQLDVYSRHLFRGATLVAAEELVPLTLVEERGFRRLRPGAEALLLLLRRLRRGGGAPAEGAELAELLRSDSDGGAAFARLVGFPESTLRALEVDEWNRLPVLAFELRAVSRLLVHPGELAACIALDYRRLRGCSLVESLERGRRVDGDRRDWIEHVARTHRVEELGG